MFGLFRLQFKPTHEIPDNKSSIWELLLDKIYTKLSKNGTPFLAIASNTLKGKSTGYISFRFRQDIDEINH